jgi:hypothetical protein
MGGYKKFLEKTLLIKEEKDPKTGEEYDDDDPENPKNKKFGETETGWDEDDLDDVGLMSFLHEVEKMAYDIRNCCRGSSCPDIGDTAKSLKDYLVELSNNLSSVIDELDNKIKD